MKWEMKNKALKYYIKRLLGMHGMYAYISNATLHTQIYTYVLFASLLIRNVFVKK